MWMAMGQFRKVIDKTGNIVNGRWKIDPQGYSHVLILKAYVYHGAQPPSKMLQSDATIKAWLGRAKRNSTQH
jgi:hypothetical protein